NRAYETATLAGFTDIEKTADLTEGGLVVSPNENNRRAEALRKLLATAPKAGTNTILITHKPNIIDALGKDWFEVKEGEASIFRPESAKSPPAPRGEMADRPRTPAAKKGGEKTPPGRRPAASMHVVRPVTASCPPSTASPCRA